MSDKILNILTYIYYFAVIVLSLYLGFYLRKRIDRYKTNKLIKELENHFGQELPTFKKDKERVNWQRVLKMLKEEPTTGKVAQWKALVKKRIATDKK